MVKNLSSPQMLGKGVGFLGERGDWGETQSPHFFVDFFLGMIGDASEETEKASETVEAAFSGCGVEELSEELSGDGGGVLVLKHCLEIKDGRWWTWLLLLVFSFNLALMFREGRNSFLAVGSFSAPCFLFKTALWLVSLAWMIGGNLVLMPSSLTNESRLSVITESSFNCSLLNDNPLLRSFGFPESFCFWADFSRLLFGSCWCAIERDFLDVFPSAELSFSSLNGSVNLSITVWISMVSMWCSWSTLLIREKTSLHRTLPPKINTSFWHVAAASSEGLFGWSTLVSSSSLRTSKVSDFFIVSVKRESGEYSTFVTRSDLYKVAGFYDIYSNCQPVI